MPQPAPFVHVRIARQTTVHQTKKKESQISPLLFVASDHESFAAAVPEFEATLDLIQTFVSRPEPYVHECRLAQNRQKLEASAVRQVCR